MDKEERPLNEDEKTLPLYQAIAVRSAISFNKFLENHTLTALDVTIASKVRYMVVWNITKGNPVQRQDAEKVREGLRVLTSASYLEPIAVLPEVVGAENSIYRKEKRKMQEKQTLLQLRTTHSFDISYLAMVSNTTEEIVYHAVMGVPVYRDEAEKILEAYSKMTGETYTLENVLITLKFEGAS